ncbi:MAG: right-handed parallel beta-helix repeat-containing protein [Rhodothermales bacterium]
MAAPSTAQVTASVTEQATVPLTVPLTVPVSELVTAPVTAPVAGPIANTLPRMNCDRAGEIRSDEGDCIPVEIFFSTGTNRIYWVDQQAGSDGNPGTKATPWKTISRSTHPAVLRPGDVVIIRAGTYRETIAPQEMGTSGLLITFSAYPGDEVVVTGADPMSDGWTRSDGAWRHAWTVPLPASPNVGTLKERPQFRREMVIVDGVVLTPVFARSDVIPGTFYVEGSDAEPMAIFMRLPGDDDPSRHVVEVGRRSALFLPKPARDDWCGGRSGFYRLVGLTFRHAVNNANWAAVCTGGRGSILEENVVEWTNGTGINIAGEANLLRGNRVNFNGMRGIGGRCAGCRLEYNETSHNNWKKHEYGYGSAGIKLIYSRETTISHHLSSDNNGTGIWLDVKNIGCVVENSVVQNNTGRGIMVEYGTVHSTIRNNVVYGTRLDGREGSGIQSQSASNNVFVHNTIVRNEGYGMWIRLSPRDTDGHNFIYNNLFVANAAHGSKEHSEIRIEGESLDHLRTNRLDGNVYWPQAAGSHTFIAASQGRTLYAGNDLTEWYSVVDGDREATMLDKALPYIEDRDSITGWRLAAGSQAVSRGVVLPAHLRASMDITSAVRPQGSPDAGAHQRSTAGE